MGTYQRHELVGRYDLAGNVKEWIWNEANPGKRYILGGAWNEPTIHVLRSRRPLTVERSANFGFRCAKYASTDESDKAARSR